MNEYREKDQVQIDFLTALLICLSKRIDKFVANRRPVFYARSGPSRPNNSSPGRNSIVPNRKKIKK